jgi:hypothetical protein
MPKVYRELSIEFSDITGSSLVVSGAEPLLLQTTPSTYFAHATRRVNLALRSNRAK